MCIHYQGSFCVVRADSTHGSKRKMFSHYHFRILFASKQSKQGCVLLTLSGLILLTYASHLTGQHLVHSHAHPSQPSRWVRRGHCLLLRGGDGEVLKRGAESPGPSFLGNRAGTQTLARGSPGLNRLSVFCSSAFLVFRTGLLKHPVPEGHALQKILERTLTEI